MAGWFTVVLHYKPGKLLTCMIGFKKYSAQWLNSAGTAFRHLCLAFHHLKFSFHHHLVMDVPSPFGGKSLKLLPPEVRFLGLNAPNSISAGAPPQTPLAEITALVQNHWKRTGLLLMGMGGSEGKRKGLRKGREGKGGEGKKCSVPPPTFE